MPRGFVNVQDDLFWTRRIRREEYHQVQTFHDLEVQESRDRLVQAVRKARSVSTLLRRRVDKGV